MSGAEPGSTRVRVRACTPADAGAVGALSREFVAYLRDLGDPAPGGVTAKAYLRDGFGERPAFTSLLAEADGRAVGYLLCHEGYDVDRGGRVLHVADLFVAGSARRAGVGRALMDAAAEVCRRAGGHALVWAVYPPNAAARAFYESLGGRYSEDLLMSRRV
ncbi:MAG TPA: GNAT family N-acetyltransferase [Longimicrobium sp.]